MQPTVRAPSLRAQNGAAHSIKRRCALKRGAFANTETIVENQKKGMFVLPCRDHFEGPRRGAAPAPMFTAARAAACAHSHAARTLTDRRLCAFPYSHAGVDVAG